MSMVSQSSIPIALNMQFNGQKRSENASILSNIEMDLRNKHVISLTIQNGRAITRPDRVAKLVTHYQTGKGYSRTHNEEDWFLDNDGFPLTWDQVQIEDPVRAQAILANDGNNPPTPS